MHPIFKHLYLALCCKISGFSNNTDLLKENFERYAKDYKNYLNLPL